MAVEQQQLLSLTSACAHPGGPLMAPVPRRHLAALLTTLTCAATALATAAPPPALAGPAGHPSPGPAARPAARPGANLLLNPGARAGATSIQGWDAVTIPGWQVSSGLPTVVRYGTAGFPSATG